MPKIIITEIDNTTGKVINSQTDPGGGGNTDPINPENNIKENMYFTTQSSTVKIRLTGQGRVEVSNNGNYYVSNLRDGITTEMQVDNEDSISSNYSLKLPESIYSVDLSENSIDSVDIVKSSNIVKLVLHDNNLTTLNIADKLPKLQYLHIFNNPICDEPTHKENLITLMKQLHDRKKSALGSVIIYPWYGLEILLEEVNGKYYKYPYIPDSEYNINNKNNPNYSKIYDSNDNYVFKADALYGIVANDTITYYRRDANNEELVAADDINTYQNLRKDLETITLPKNWVFGSAVLYDDEAKKCCPWDFIQNHIADVWETTQKGFGHKFAWLDEIYGVSPGWLDMNVAEFNSGKEYYINNYKNYEVPENIKEGGHGSITLSMVVGRGGIYRFGYCPNATMYAGCNYTKDASGTYQIVDSTAATLDYIDRWSNKIDSLGIDMNYSGAIDNTNYLLRRNSINTKLPPIFLTEAAGNEGDAIDWTLSNTGAGTDFCEYFDVEASKFQESLNQTKTPSDSTDYSTDIFKEVESTVLQQNLIKLVNTNSYKITLAPSLYFIALTDPENTQESGTVSIVRRASNGVSQQLNYVSYWRKGAFFSVSDVPEYTTNMNLSGKYTTDILNYIKVYQVYYNKGTTENPEYVPMPKMSPSKLLGMCSIEPNDSIAGHSNTSNGALGIPYTRDDAFSQYGTQIVVSTYSATEEGILKTIQGTSFAIPAGHASLVLMERLYRKLFNVKHKLRTGKHSAFMNYVRHHWTTPLMNSMDTASGYGKLDLLSEPNDLELLSSEPTVNYSENVIQYEPLNLDVQIDGNCKKNYTVGGESYSKGVDYDNFIVTEENTIIPLCTGTQNLTIYTNSSYETPTDYSSNYYKKNIELTIVAPVEQDKLLVETAEIKLEEALNKESVDFTVHCELDWNMLCNGSEEHAVPSMYDAMDEVRNNGNTKDITEWTNTGYTPSSEEYVRRISLIKINIPTVENVWLTLFFNFVVSSSNLTEDKLLSNLKTRAAMYNFDANFATHNSFKIDERPMYQTYFEAYATYRISAEEVNPIITLVAVKDKLSVYYNGNLLGELLQDDSNPIRLKDVNTNKNGVSISSPFVKSYTKYDVALTQEEIVDYVINYRIAANSAK